MSNQENFKVVVDDVGILKILENEPFVALKERDLIEGDNAITSSWTIPKKSYHMVTSFGHNFYN
jgi:hypothetical protein